jgi:exosortase/archaeosortase family protein
MESFELLSYLFAFVVLLDWNRLRRGRAFLVYLGCLSSILVCNALRIAIVVVLFNRGYSAIASSFHLTASSFFFFAIFLVYMSLTHRWMTNQPRFHGV